MRVTIDVSLETAELIDRRATLQNIPWSTAATHILELGANVCDQQYDQQYDLQHVEEATMDAKPEAVTRYETEEHPAMEVHLGEIYSEPSPASWERDRKRHCIIWINGKRWEGELYEVLEENSVREGL